MKKTALFFAIAGLVFCFFINSANACTGARQAAMGDASITVCDDSQAVYWNQAALPTLKRAEISYTHRFGDMDYRYDHVISVSVPYRQWGFGAQYVHSDTYTRGTLQWLGAAKLTETGEREKWSWLTIGIGRNILKTDNFNLSIGGAIRSHWWEYTNQFWGKHDTDDSFSFPYKYRGQELYYDASVLASWVDLFQEKSVLRLGMLWQSIPDNLRPGASYSFPVFGRETTLAISLYDITHSGLKETHLGAEMKFGALSVRGGIYHSRFSRSDLSMNCGAGYRFGIWSVDFTANPESVLFGLSAFF